MLANMGLLKKRRVQPKHGDMHNCHASVFTVLLCLILVVSEVRFQNITKASIKKVFGISELIREFLEYIVGNYSL